MTTIPEIWKYLAKAVHESPGCPQWLRRQAQLSWEDLSRLPVVDNTVIGQDAAPTTEQRTVTSEYLDFLREQIELNARGAEWNSVLENRMSALVPLVGDELLVVMFYCKPHTATFRIDPKSKTLIHMEVN